MVGDVRNMGFEKSPSPAVYLPYSQFVISGVLFAATPLVEAVDSGPDKMERPTSALHSAGYAARAPLNAEGRACRSTITETIGSPTNGFRARRRHH